jgi:hypothetical protein
LCALDAAPIELAFFDQPLGDQLGGVAWNADCLVRYEKLS